MADHFFPKNWSGGTDFPAKIPVTDNTHVDATPTIPTPKMPMLQDVNVPECKLPKCPLFGLL